jgi:serine/threonine protein kinase
MGSAGKGDLPKTIGRYEVLDRIARGGMAEVFLGRATGEGGFERLVAIKRMLPHLTETEGFGAMFLDEARISAELQNGNIGQVFDFGRDDDSPYLVMEFIPGVDLLKMVKHCPRPGPTVSAYVISNVCAALDHAHSRRDADGRPLGIVHRDVSPSNVLVTFEGDVKLIDFGVARAAERLQQTQGGTLKGKFAYMSPEQASGLPLDHRSDIFAAGIVLHELLTGRSLFRLPGDTDLGTLHRVQAAEVSAPSSLDPGLPEDLDRICLRALAKKPEDRFATAGELQAALEEHCHRAGFGRRQFALWMQETMPDFQAQILALLQRARLGPAQVEPARDRSGDRPVEEGAAALGIGQTFPGSQDASLAPTMAASPFAHQNTEAVGQPMYSTVRSAAGEKLPHLAPPGRRSSPLRAILILAASTTAFIGVAFFLLGKPTVLSGKSRSDRSDAGSRDEQAQTKTAVQKPAPPEPSHTPAPDSGPDDLAARRLEEHDTASAARMKSPSSKTRVEKPKAPITRPTKAAPPQPPVKSSPPAPAWDPDPGPE